MTQSLPDTITSATVESFPPKLLAQFREMIYAVPDYDAGGVASIIGQIFEAKTAADLESPWGDSNRELPLGVPILVHMIAKSPSDFADGLGFYLTLDCVVLHNGESAQFVTGSASICAQLVKAYVSGMLPLTCMAVEPEKASRNGYKPQHLEIITDEAKKTGTRKNG